MHIWGLSKRTYFSKAFWYIVVLIFKGLLAYYVVLASLYAGANYTGYCVQQQRLISEEEMVRSAVEYVNAKSSVSVSVKVDGKTQPKSYPRIRYESSEELLAENPGCCSFGLTSRPTRGVGILGPPQFIDRISGAHRGYVHIEYAMRYLANDGTVKSVQKTWVVAIGNCGARDVVTSE